MAQMRIFVSHSSADNLFADALVKALRQAGADVWYDEHNLGTGQVRDTVQRELIARPVFVVVLSKAAFASEWVRDECGWAWNLCRREPKRIILPVIAQRIDHGDFNVMLFLEDFKRVGASSQQPYHQAEAIARTLRLLALTPSGQPSTPTTPHLAESVSDLIARGRALVTQKRCAEAVPFFECATQLEPDNFDAWFNLGYAHSELGQWRESLAACDRALAISPDRALAWAFKAGALHGLGQYPESLAAWDRSLEFDLAFALAWNGKGWALNGLGRYAEALSALDCALAIDPTDTLALVGKGNALCGRDQAEEALAAFDHALAIDPDYANAWAHKSETLRALGREAEAQDAERRAKELGG